MTIQDFAHLPENRSGFWIQKQYGETGRCTYIVFYQGMTEFRDSISDAKQRLRDRYARIQANIKIMGFNPSLKMTTGHVWLAYGAPLILRS